MLINSHTSRDAKLKEWRCNIFSLSDREEVPLFKRKKRSVSGLSLSCESMSNVIAQSKGVMLHSGSAVEITN